MRARLDRALVARGLVASRSRARDLISRGFVFVDGVVEAKPARLVSSTIPISLGENTPLYVSRGAEKLVGALDAFAFQVGRARIIDVGASTGGFVQVLLERGAGQVYAVDVGSGQLHASLRCDPRVINLEGKDARSLAAGDVAGCVDGVVIDVSFVSMIKVLPGVLGFVRPGGWLVGLIKPQFEVGAAHVSKDGVVRDAAARMDAVNDVRDWISGQGGWSVVGVMDSPIDGGAGNKEYLIGATFRGAQP